MLQLEDKFKIRNLLSRLQHQEIYLGEVKPKKNLLVLGIVFLLLILLGVLWGTQKLEKIAELGQYEGKLLEAEFALSQSTQLLDLNPVRAQELARKAKSMVEELTKKGVKDERFRRLKTELEANMPKLLGEYQVEGRFLVDVGLVREGFTPTQVVVSHDRILALDASRKLVILFNFEGGNMQVLSGPDNVPQARLVAIWETQSFVLDGQRVAKIEKEEGQAVARSLILPEGSWGRISQMAAFGGNLYLVDSVKNQIWRYSLAAERVGQGEAWLAPDTQSRVLLDNVVSMSIDGSIWLLRKDGKILKFARGVPEAFRIEGLEREFVNPKALVSSSGFKNLYILDSTNRVVVLDKRGQYKAQYLWDKIGEARSMAVSEEKKKLLLFVGSKVYEIELR